jgi:hypothetical protein
MTIRATSLCRILTAICRLHGAKTLVCVIFIAYLLTYGPICWSCSHGYLHSGCAWRIYRPITWVQYHGPPALTAMIDAYAQRWAGLSATWEFMFFEFQDEQRTDGDA